VEREKWKEGDQGPSQKKAGESKEKEKPRPCISKKRMVLKRKTWRRKLCQETGLPIVSKTG
jgi:hypothetical protein